MYILCKNIFLSSALCNPIKTFSIHLSELEVNSYSPISQLVLENKHKLFYLASKISLFSLKYLSSCLYLHEKV